jgi:hypothetical protein
MVFGTPATRNGTPACAARAAIARPAAIVPFSANQEQRIDLARGKQGDTAVEILIGQAVASTSEGRARRCFRRRKPRIIHR